MVRFKTIYSRRIFTAIECGDRAVNLRLSAFICGLKKPQKTRQPYFNLKLEFQRLLFAFLYNSHICILKRSSAAEFERMTIVETNTGDTK